MAFGVELSFAIFVVLFVLKLPLLVCGVQQVPCYFVFGDSSVDNGNNNQLETQAKSNYLPYGIDFRDGPTGRFTNGRNNADILAELLGFDDYIPPFATARGTNILKGVNYASGGAGIRAETGQNLGERISLDMQLTNHRTTISRIASLQRNKNSTKEYLKKCLYTVAMGSNDYINNYLMPNNYTSSRLYTPDQYAAALIQQYSNQLMTLYSYGARKVAVFGLGAIGYIPEQVANFGTNGSTYSEVINNEVQLFNDRLKPLIDELNKKLADAHFIYVNLTSISSSGYLSSIGFNLTHAPCCMVSTNIAKGQCVPNQIPCDNRNTYLFLDAYHPTEIVNLLLTSRSYIALTPFDAYPFDISTLALI